MRFVLQKEKAKKLGYLDCVFLFFLFDFFVDCGYHLFACAFLAWGVKFFVDEVSALEFPHCFCVAALVVHPMVVITLGMSIFISATCLLDWKSVNVDIARAIKPITARLLRLRSRLIG